MSTRADDYTNDVRLWKEVFSVVHDSIFPGWAGAGLGYEGHQVC